MGEPLAVVVARDRYTAEDAVELIEVEYEPLEPCSTRRPGEVVSDRSFSYGDPEEAFAAADLVVEGRFAFPRWTARPVECYGVVADWNEATGADGVGELPGAVHAALRRRRRARAPRGRSCGC